MILLNLLSTAEVGYDQLEERLRDAQVPFSQSDGAGLIVACADQGTADFWDERFTSWGVKVERSGEDEPGHFGTQDINEVSEEPADVQPS